MYEYGNGVYIPLFCKYVLSCLHSVFPRFARTGLFVDVPCSSCVLCFPWGFEDLMRSGFGVTKVIIYIVLYASSTWHMVQYPKVATANSIITYLLRVYQSTFFKEIRGLICSRAYGYTV